MAAPDRRFRLSPLTKFGAAMLAGGLVLSGSGYAAAHLLSATGIFVDALEILVLVPLTILLVGAPLLGAVVGGALALLGLIVDLVRW